MNTTLENIMPTTNQFHFHNSYPNSNNNLGRTTCVATNLRSYCIPVNRDNTHDDSRGRQSNGRYRHRSTSSRDRHSHCGSCWTNSEAACRFFVMGVVGLTLKQLADYGRNQHNLTLALSPSMHAYVHWLLS
jgi:hypothetical protein